MACNFNISAGSDTSLCGPSTFQLIGTTDLPQGAITSVLWQPGAGLSDSTILNPIVNINSSTTYTLIVQSNLGTELIFNGDFSLGDTGFVSDYIQGQGGISGIVSDPGEYDINTNPHNSHIDFASFGDHTNGTGNMLIVNGSDSFNDTLWCQSVQVVPGNNYNFSAWASTANWQNPAILRFMINGISLGPDLYLAADTGVWHPFNAIWNSGILTSANVCLMDMSTWSAGNDFVIDDISLLGPCLQTDSITITISNSVAVSLGNDSTICSGDTIQLNAGYGFTNYTWQFNGVIQASQDSIFLATQPGTYVVQITTVDSCTATDTLLILSGAASISLPSDTTICENESIIISAATGFSQYQWYYNNVQLPFSGNIISVSLPGTYALIAQDAAGCSATDSMALFNDQNFISAGSDVSFCQGDSLLITLSYSPALSLMWYYNGISNGSAADSLFVTQNGIYTVTGISLLGCVVSDSVVVTVNDLPEVITLNDTVICSGSQLNLFVNGAANYQWSPSTYLDDPASADPLSIPLAPITYIVTGMNVQGCESSDTIFIDINEAPESFFTIETEISCEGIILSTENNSTDASNYLWTFGDGNFSTDQNPIHIYSEFNNYVVQLVSINGNCSDTSAIITGLNSEEGNIAEQNVFTPNNDGLNDCFDGGIPTELSACSSLEIFNRWGNKVYSTSTSSRCWNGKKDSTGEELPEGVYFYVMNLKSRVYKGTVSLKR